MTEMHKPLKQVVGWVAWYDEGGRFDSDTHEWESLPERGIVLVLLLFNDGTCRRCMGTDLYYLHDFGWGTVYANDNDRDGLLSRLGWVKFGRWAPEGIVDLIEREASRVQSEWVNSGGKKPEKDCGCGS